MIVVKALYTIREVADMLGIGVRKVRRMVRLKQLDAEKIGESYFIPLSTLQARAALWESIELRQAFAADAT